MDESNTIGGFKKYIKTSTRIIDRISVTTGGSIGFPSSFSEEHGLKDYVSANLYWNSETNEVGIQFTKEDGENNTRLIKNPYGEGRTINARAFFAVNHLVPSNYSTRYEYRIVNFNELDTNDTSAEKLYVIKLVKKEIHKEQPQGPIVVAPVPQPTPEPAADPVSPPINPNLEPTPTIPGQVAGA